VNPCAISLVTDSPPSCLSSTSHIALFLPPRIPTKYTSISYRPLYSSHMLHLNFPYIFTGYIQVYVVPLCTVPVSCTKYVYVLYSYVYFPLVPLTVSPVPSKCPHFTVGATTSLTYLHLTLLWFPLMVLIPGGGEPALELPHCLFPV
jgi:hypothetical protein